MRITETLQVLSDSTRLRMLRLLAQEELSVAELQEILRWASPKFLPIWVCCVGMTW